MNHRRNCGGENATGREGGCSAANPGFTILQLYRFYPFWCTHHPPLIISHISTFCSDQLFPPLSSHLREKMWFLFLFWIFGFCGEDHYWLSHLMQCNEANTFSLFYLLATKTFVTNCVLCWTGTSSCGTEKRNGGVDMWTRIGEIKASTPKEKTRKSNDTSGDINHYRNCEVCPVSLCIFGSLNPIVIFHGAS